MIWVFLFLPQISQIYIDSWGDGFSAVIRETCGKFLFVVFFSRRYHRFTQIAGGSFFCGYPRNLRGIFICCFFSRRYHRFTQMAGGDGFSAVIREICGKLLFFLPQISQIYTDSWGGWFFCGYPRNLRGIFICCFFLPQISQIYTDSWGGWFFCDYQRNLREIVNSGLYIKNS